MNPAARILASLLVCTASGTSAAQDVYALWAGDETPYSKENDLEESEKISSFGVLCAYDVTAPTLTVYPAEGTNSRRAVVILPGGGYEVVAVHHEGYDVAEALAARGVTAAVLKYRLPRTESSDQPHLVPLADARRALKLLRSHAAKYGFDESKLGVLGFSAGSHLAAVVSLWKSDDEAENPSFSGLVYGVTDLDPSNREWLEKSLYHRELTADEVARNKLLNLVSSASPPAFLVHAYDDESCNVKESTLYASKCFEHGVPVEMHLFRKGGHGFGVGRAEDGTDQWIGLFVRWLTTNI